MRLDLTVILSIYLIIVLLELVLAITALVLDKDEEGNPIEITLLNVVQAVVVSISVVIVPAVVILGIVEWMGTVVIRKGEKHE